jgi:methylthioribose-1-phosphate isomerase
MVQNVRPLAWSDGAVVMLDQRVLPETEHYNTYTTVEEVAEAIRTMVIRGAPAIGCAAALGVTLAARSVVNESVEAVDRAARDAAALLAKTRPTAVNLSWALERMLTRLDLLAHDADEITAQQLVDRLLAEATCIIDEDVEANRQMGRFGAELLPPKATVLTHCNTGALATGGYGTALGVIRAAVESGKTIRVYADETRPWLQGARLTAWELDRDGIDVTVITDSTAGALMSQGQIDAAIVGSDRIAANGDVANKIGTYTVAVLCRHHGIPFYVAAPMSTVDLSTPSGEHIPIEERPHEEVTTIGMKRFVPESVPVRNIAFDITPASLVSAIITEKGVARPPYSTSLSHMTNTTKA